MHNFNRKCYLLGAVATGVLCLSILLLRNYYSARHCKHVRMAIRNAAGIGRNEQSLGPIVITLAENAETLIPALIDAPNCGLSWDSLGVFIEEGVSSGLIDRLPDVNNLRAIVVTCKRDTHIRVLRVIDRLESLNSFELRDCEFLNPVDLSLLPMGCRLRTFGAPQAQEVDKIIRIIASRCPRLTTADLRQTDISQGAVVELRRIQTLEDLHIEVMGIKKLDLSELCGMPMLRRVHVGKGGRNDLQLPQGCAFEIVE